RNAFANVNLPSRDHETKEDRWRMGLYRLVKIETDGTARTDVISADTLKGFFLTARESFRLDEILELLIRPEVLLLRRFSILNRAIGKYETKYSLGHDAIGLALPQWQLERKEAERARSLRKKVVAVTILGIVTALTLVGYNIWTKESNILVQVSGLRTAA